MKSDVIVDSDHGQKSLFNHMIPQKDPAGAAQPLVLPEDEATEHNANDSDKTPKHRYSVIPDKKTEQNSFVDRLTTRFKNAFSHLSRTSSYSKQKSDSSINTSGVITDQITTETNVADCQP
jgi:hypothetical protein